MYVTDKSCNFVVEDCLALSSMSTFDINLKTKETGNMYALVCKLLGNVLSLDSNTRNLTQKLWDIKRVQKSTARLSCIFAA